MRTSSRIATVCFIGAAFAALVSACGSSDAAPPAGGAGAGTAGAGTAGAGTAGAGTAGAATAGAAGAALTGDPVNGAVVYKDTMKTACDSCHGPNAEGMLGPNITGSMSAGIGSWTQAQFHEALRNSKNRKGTKLCGLMPAFTPDMITEQGIADVYAFVKTKNSDTAVIGTYCAPGMCPGGTCSGAQN